LELELLVFQGEGLDLEVDAVCVFGWEGGKEEKEGEE